MLSTSLDDYLKEQCARFIYNNCSYSICKQTSEGNNDRDKNNQKNILNACKKLYKNQGSTVKGGLLPECLVNGGFLLSKNMVNKISNVMSLDAQQKQTCFVAEAGSSDKVKREDLNN